MGTDGGNRLGMSAFEYLEYDTEKGKALSAFTSLALEWDCNDPCAGVGNLSGIQSQGFAMLSRAPRFRYSVQFVCCTQPSSGLDLRV